MPRQSQFAKMSALEAANHRSVMARETFHLASKRGPDRREQALLRRLLDGPCELLAGPVGRCLKRGWIVFDAPMHAEGRRLAANGDLQLNTPMPVYRITELGRAASTAPNPPPRAG